jgi:hypothetical protein
VGEENGEDMFFMMLFTEFALPRLRREGARSSSGLEGMKGLDWFLVSGWRIAGEEGGEANGDVRVFTRLFTLSRFRGVSGCSEGWSWLFKSGVNGERPGETNGEKSGRDMIRARYWG